MAARGPGIRDSSEQLRLQWFRGKGSSGLAAKVGGRGAVLVEGSAFL